MRDHGPRLRDQVHVVFVQPHAVNDVQPLAEKPGVAHVANERASVQALLAENALQLGLEDVDVKRQVVAAAQVIDMMAFNPWNTTDEFRPLGNLNRARKKVYDAGGLALHAGCKVVPVGSQQRVFLIVGLSGTGKTTTPFTRQNNSKPVQDDFVALMPQGRIYGTENGCFAKTFGLDPKHEPTIYGAVTKRDAYLENVSQKEDGGPVDFFDTSYTQNGRATFVLSALGWVEDARNIGPADVLLILNRNDNIIPGVARLDSAHAAAYFMLGETKGTSAGGKEEMGKALRVPGTNPFFPLRHEQQGNRFLELHRSRPFEVYLMNTGSVGGADGGDGSKKLTIEYSSAIVKAIAEGTIAWTNDPDFGYEVAAGVPGVDDVEVLQPQRLYQRTGRGDEYRGWVQRLKLERAAEFKKYPGLDPEIVAAVD